ncbi:transferrin-binding protein-like solute binding protein [Emcibacter sp.]|uniref:transferrin-binding protein-like solute binding protein n=1 Tax=Emcibacter sp. TaxID=1979954 RepID=UPI003A90BDD2
MRQISKFRNILLTAGSVVALAACGGSNGGSSTPPPSTPTPPTSNDRLDQIQASEDFNSLSSVVLVKVEGITETIDSASQTESAEAVVGLDADVNTAADFTITITNQGAGNDVNFDHTFDAADKTVGTRYTQYVDGNQAFVLLRPGVDITIPFHPSGETINLSYVTYGQWAKTDGTVAANGFEKANGFVTFGIRTDSVPTTGEASYEGIAEGVLYRPTATAGSPDQLSLLGRVEISANFGTNTVVSEFRDFQATGVGGGAWVEFDSTGTLSNGAFSGAASNFSAGGYSGTVSGAFYGPNAQEVGGVWSISGPGEEAAGAFAGEQ